MSTTIIHWFRKGLRIHDNPSLKIATDLIEKQPEKYVFRAIFILDPAILKWLRVGANRFRFLQQSLIDLDHNLKSINSRLYVVRGNPVDVFPRIFKEWNVELLTFESDIEPYAIKRDKMILDIADKLKIEVIQELSHTIYDPGLVLKQNHGKPVVTYQKFLSIVESHVVKIPIKTPNKLPKMSQPGKDSFEMKNSECYDVPLLSELQVNESELGPNLFMGGETEGLNRMEKYLKQTKWICAFEKPNTAPNSIEPSTTVLSPYLKFGCLSSRLFYTKLKAILEKNKQHSKPPVSLMGQLMWREFYYAAGFAVTKFDQMKDNSVCMQIPWNNNKNFLNAWTHAKTGYPFIDAIMRQLRQEGWIHHLARHAVACFLTRGDLWISWEEGQKVFEELLLDADWALNAGNWMWLSASAFFHQFFRVYSPVQFGKKTDPEGKYIKKYVPELKKFPSDLIYEPWKASLKMQQVYGCIIGTDYPNRIVIHEDVYKVNIKKMSEAYKQNKSLKLSENLAGSSTAVKRKSEASTSGSINKKIKKQPNIKSYFSKK